MNCLLSAKSSVDGILGIAIRSKFWYISYCYGEVLKRLKRGALAKGVDVLKRARVRIPSSPLIHFKALHKVSKS